MDKKENNKRSIDKLVRWERPKEPWIKINTDGVVIRDRNAAGSGGVWERPKEPWIKINTDGVVIRENNAAGSGGVARDANGNWLFGYTRSIGRCDVLQAELWGVLDGLTIAWSWSFQQVIVECDNQSVIEWINNKDNPGCNNSLRDAINELKNRNGNVHFRNIYREANRVADALVKRSLNAWTELTVYMEIPQEIKSVVKEDQIGKSFKRRNASHNE